MRVALAALAASLAAQIGVGYLAVADVLGDGVEWWTRPRAEGHPLDD